AMLMLLRRMNVEGVTVHGFRSTFRDWASEEANAPREVAEMSLAHRVGSEVERAYARSDLLDKRRELMLRWANFVTGCDAFTEAK
ncbi:MAG: integrase, partial [Parasphingorhabdus sp.]